MSSTTIDHTEQLTSIAKEAAFIAAVLSDSTLEPVRRARELRDSLAILMPQLQELGLMEAYERGEGFGV